MIIKLNITNKIISICFLKNNKIIFVIKNVKNKIRILINEFKKITNFYNEEFHFKNYKYKGHIKKIVDSYYGKKVNKNT
ncbi:hypothetical protein CRP_142 [Candidatus Carsonella ruddii PV]|uniref:Uncharacterized protein n=1 Tax=Carsonella ruddii (strain PV) TaxID=387662 RepID=Q05FJ8_CARRP|nr:hypothetical protein [Candidatus Carsonella ruddii]BAF35173.1 hypothetical protein CRP_142 [Candidatus Carsonella ruddii PV]